MGFWIASEEMKFLNQCERLVFYENWFLNQRDQKNLYLYLGCCPHDQVSTTKRKKDE